MAMGRVICELMRTSKARNMTNIIDCGGKSNSKLDYDTYATMIYVGLEGYP